MVDRGSGYDLNLFGEECMRLPYRRTFVYNRAIPKKPAGGISKTPSADTARGGFMYVALPNRSTFAGFRSRWIPHKTDRSSVRHKPNSSIAARHPGRQRNRLRIWGDAECASFTMCCCLFRAQDD